MTYLTCAVFLLVSAAIFLIGGLDEALAARLRRGKKAGAIRLRKRTPFTRLQRLEQKRRRLIAEARIPKPVYWLLTCFCAAVGAVLGRLIFYHPFFSVTIGILSMFGPLFYLGVRLTNAKSRRMEKLHSSILILSNSYIVTEDFLQSVRDNLGILEYPAPFRDFLVYTNYINSSVKTGLRRMEAQVSNDYFSQWVNVLILAQDDRAMKYVTMSVVDAMADVRQAQRESDTAMYAIWREYFTVLALIFAAPVIFRVLMKSAYTILVMTLPGQVLLVFLLAAVVFSLVRAYRLNKPLLL